MRDEEKKYPQRVIGRFREQIPTAPGSVARNISREEQEFIDAMREYQATSGRLFPAWSEVLEVLQKLGYRKKDSEESAPHSSRS